MNTWKELGTQLIKKGLPLIGGLLGGPVGALGAKAAVSLLSSTLNLPEEATPEEIVGTIRANPEALIKLKEAELKHKERLQELLLEETRLTIQDTADARNREIAITKITGKRDINLYILAWSVVIGFFAMTGMMYFRPIPPAAIGPINQLFGALAAGFGLVLGYFFGSSKSSTDKTKLMAK